MSALEMPGSAVPLSSIEGAVVAAGADASDATALPKTHKGVAIDDHMLSIEQMMARYQVQFNDKKPGQSRGLTAQIVQERETQFGRNVMTPPKEVSLIVRYLICLSNLFNVLLIVAGVLCYILYAMDPINNFPNVYVGAILFVVAALNALIEFVQELKSQAILKSFLDLVPRNCLVIRDSQLVTLDASHLVPGDLVNIRMGDKLPADVRIMSSSELKVDNSSLTGEADPQERMSKNTHENILEATNLAFNGTLAVNGDAFGVVVRTGDNSMLGQIANLASSEKKRVSPLTQEIDAFVHMIAVIAFICAAVFFGISYGNNGDLAFSINFAIGVFVSFVPEGLPATVTMLLSIAAKRMAKMNVLVKDLRGVETLGAITCLATDKTGTLTRNQMTVTNMWSALKLWDASLSQKEENVVPKAEEAGVVPDYTKDGEMQAEMQPMQQTQLAAVEDFDKFDLSVPELNDMAHICYLCSKAKYDRNDVPIKQRNIIGDATETGLLTFASSTLADSDGLHDKFPTVFEIPFNSSNKWALTVHKKPHSTGIYTLYIKGAPERVIRLCNAVMNGGKVEKMTESHQASYQKSYEFMASKGHRVIGCAKMELSSEQFPEGFTFIKEIVEQKDGEPPAKVIPNSGLYPTKDYTFVGLVSLEDPPKHGVREAIGQCRQAGVKVMMVTGDHPLTAEAIGRKINLMLQETRDMVAERTGRAASTIQDHEFNAVVIHGEMIDKLTEDEWDKILDKEEIIFARTSPKHKLQIVKRCQARGHIVGVTGDGVNDSPALKKADLGIAMNVSGSDVSKEAAAMILLDDNFASTVSGIAEGRLIFQNLKKSIRYTISHTMPEVVANLLFVIVPIPLPMSPVQIILVDLGFELFIALMYAWEVPESKSRGLMTKLPRKPVTHKSIDLLYRENAFKDIKNRTISNWVYGEGHVEVPVDANADKVKMSSSVKFKFQMARIRYFFSTLFNRDIWRLRTEPREEEVLVDWNVLSWAYLEIGMLESIGCLLAFFHVYWVTIGWSPATVRQKALANPSNFSDPEEDRVLRIAQSAFYLGICIQQCFNHFMCKVTVRLPFGKMLLRNTMSWYGVLFGLLFAIFIVYPPFMAIPFHTERVNPLFWVFPILMGFVIIAYTALRVLYFRRKQPVNYNMDLPLDLHPTRWSTTSNGQ